LRPRPDGLKQFVDRAARCGTHADHERASGRESRLSHPDLQTEGSALQLPHDHDRREDFDEGVEPEACERHAASGNRGDRERLSLLDPVTEPCHPVAVFDHGNLVLAVYDVTKRSA
jgi:hypothetical protein